MGIVVQKFGGRLLESPDKIRRAARYVVQSKLRGDDPVVVVSAPGRATDHLLRWAGKVSEHPDRRELDMLLSVGERMAMALMALAINAEGSFQAVSYTGSQVGIITDTRHTDASIIEVKGFRIREAITRGQIPIIAGFQGISTEKEITTLGRGGSDATAVALAAAIGADRCELIKEAGGIFSADPLQVEDARLLREIDYGTLESMTEAGAKVVQPRAATLAREHKVVLAINAPDGKRGTLVSDRSLSHSAIAALTLRLGLKVATHPGNMSTPRDSGLAAWVRNSEGLTFSFDPQDQGLDAEAVTVVGWGGRLPGNAVISAVKALNTSGIEPIGYFRASDTLLLAVAPGEGRNALQAIHHQAIIDGFIEEPQSEGEPVF